MSIYIKKFENHTHYENYINSSKVILPNVSLCENEKDVHFNPYVHETRLIAKYNVTSTSEPTSLRTNYENNIFKSMEIDGIMLNELVTEYTFDTIGEHIVKYELYDETKLGNMAPVFYNSNLVECIIPDSVTSIGNNAFYYCNGLISIHISSSVTSIGSSAFYYCSGLTSITIPDSVTSIGDSVFNGTDALKILNYNAKCELSSSFRGTWVNLETVIIGNSTPSIGASAFQTCTGLTSVIIGNSVTSIGNYAFQTCTSLTSIYIPDSITSIGDSVFKSCISLTSINIPNSVTSIGSYAFHNCSNLTSINIPDSITSISSSIFAECSGLTSIDIPNSIISIGDAAFYNCGNLTSCTIGSGVTSIGNGSFGYCSGLTSITSNATTAPTIQNGTFQNVKIGGTLTVPIGSNGYDVWMGTGDYYLGKYNWTKVEQ